MRKSLIAISAAVLLAQLISSCTCADCPLGNGDALPPPVFTVTVNDISEDAVVTFPDENLRLAVLQYLGKNEGDVITKREARRVYSVNIWQVQGLNLEGIENLENLYNLSAVNCVIKDLAPLTKLHSLENLYLYNNGLTDISGFSGADMPSLKRIWISGNKITDLAPLSGKPALEAIYAQYNGLTDISGLAGCTGLVHLFISKNNVTDISPVAGMPGLIVLGVDGNAGLSDLKPLANNRVMLEFYASGCSISDISVVSNWSKLKSLDLGGNKITDITSVLDSFNSGAYRAEYWTCFVSLYGNPLGFKAINCDIPMLKGFGLQLYTEYAPQADPAEKFVADVLARQMAVTGLSGN